MAALTSGTTVPPAIWKLVEDARELVLSRGLGGRVECKPDAAGNYVVTIVVAGPGPRKVTT
jgi:hypothetical protein